MIDNMTLYIIKYYTGDESGGNTVTVFVTSNLDTAKQYILKFNTILNKWKTFMKQFKGIYGIPDRSLELPMIVDRYYDILEINEAYYEEIKFRN